MKNPVEPFLFVLLLWFVSWSANGLADEIDADFYSTQIKPLFIEKCSACHGPVKQEAGLRLDTASFIRQGSDQGPIVTPVAIDDSLLLKRIQDSNPDRRMPPEGEGVPLKGSEIEKIRAWITRQMPAPDNEKGLSGPEDHWSFRPILRPKLDQSAAGFRSPIDQLLAEVYIRRGIVPLPMAESAILLRRLTLDLTGLPPTKEEIETFLADPRQDAYDRQVDQLLNRASYGERWGRHWMDIWRYSDWDGYKEELRGSQRNIWHWRDWIIESLNENKPYDQMIVEMLAGDEIAPLHEKTLRATGFLARNFHKSNRNIWLDATVEHTGKAFLALTINCSKCHDHKYDPISQKDFYSFRAIFEPHQVRTDSSSSNNTKQGIPRAFDSDPKAPTYLFVRGDDKHPVKDQPIGPSMPGMLPFEIAFDVASVNLPWESYLPELKPEAERTAIAKAWDRLDGAHQSWNAAREKQKATERGDAKSTSEEIDLRFELLKLREAEAFLTSLKARYAADKSYHRIGKESRTSLVAKNELENSNPSSLADYAREAEQTWKEIESELRVANARRSLRKAEESSEKDAKKKQTAIDKAKKELVAAEEGEKKLHASDGTGKLKAHTPIVAGFPSESTGRRLALARWIVDRKNPLTARVAVNHIWTRHFGAPIVENVFDFGMKTPEPDLLRLLDWLAAEFIDSGWDMKHLHRLIVASAAYRRASSGESERVASAIKLDPDNRLFWRANIRRLDAEEVRDSLLVCAQMMDPTMGGPDISEKEGETVLRRSVYFRHAYEKQMTMMVMFDAASPSECYRRKPSIIPQQALVLANSSLARTASRKMANRIWNEVKQDQNRFIEQLFLESLGRKPTEVERTSCRDFLEHRFQSVEQTEKLAKDGIQEVRSKQVQVSEPPATEGRLRACQNLTHVLLNHNDFVSAR